MLFLLSAKYNKVDNWMSESYIDKRSQGELTSNGTYVFRVHCRHTHARTHARIYQHQATQNTEQHINDTDQIPVKRYS